MKFLLNFAFLDAATPWQLGFQDPATPIIIGIIHFHNHLIFFLVVIGTFVFWLLYKALVLFKEDPSREASKFTHSTPLEVVWTITPALLLLLIAGPSFANDWALLLGLTNQFLVVKGFFRRFFFLASTSIKKGRRFVKKDFEIFFTYPDFRRYILTFICLIIFTIVWGSLFSENMVYLAIGVGLTMLGVKTIISCICYPLSLGYLAAKPLSRYETIKKLVGYGFLISLMYLILFYSKVLGALIFGWSMDLANLIFNNAINLGQRISEDPVIAEFPAIAGLATSVCLIFLIVIMCLGFVYTKRALFSRLNFLSSSNTISRQKKKVLLFFRLYPIAKKNFLVCILGWVTVVADTTFLLGGAFLCSIRHDGGVWAYWVFVCGLLLTLLVTLPSFTDWFFSRYRRNGLRMLGWNGPELNLYKLAASVIGVTVTTAAGIGVTEEIARKNQAREDEFEEKRWRKAIDAINVARELNPGAVARGELDYPKPPEYKPRRVIWGTSVEISQNPKVAISQEATPPDQPKPNQSGKTGNT